MSEPIYYRATRKTTGERIAPRDVLHQCVELPCTGCETTVLVVKKTMMKTVEIAKRKKRLVAICCPRCFELAMENVEDIVILKFNDQEILDLLVKHEAERN